MIETNTVSAAMFAIRSPSGTAEPSTNRAKVIVATPLGPNQAMNAFSAVSTCARAGQRGEDRDRARHQQREGDDRQRAAQPSLEQAVEA